MLGKVDELVSFFESRGLEVGYIFPTETGLKKSIMDAHEKLRSYFRHVGLHDYDEQEKGQTAKVKINTFLVGVSELKETVTSLYRPETKSGDPRIWISGLQKYAIPGDLIAILVLERDIYAINVSSREVLESENDPSSPFSYLLNRLYGVKSKPLSDKYCEWNLRLLRSFFSKASNGEEVFLRVDKDFLDQIGQDIGGDEGFLRAVSRGPLWTSPARNLVERVLELLLHQKLGSHGYQDPGDFDPNYRGLRAPLYLPYLAALVRNCSVGLQGYYRSLINDFNLIHFGSPEMIKFENVWQDLEEWTHRNKGAFGYFNFRRLGGYGRIGVPRSQSILKPQDFERLPYAFAHAQIRAGQNLSDDDITRIFNAAKLQENIFTAGFNQALRGEDFEQPIRSLIRTAYIEWDGTLPSRKRSDDYTRSHSNGFSRAGEIGLSLLVEYQHSLKLLPRWHLPSIKDSGDFELIHEDIRWDGVFYGTEGVSTKWNTCRGDNFWRIVALSAEESLEFELQYGQAEDSEYLSVPLTLSPHPLWVLVPFINALNGQTELKDSYLPASGPAYLLAPPSKVSCLQSYFEHKQPKGEIIYVEGLPSDWLLICLSDCSILSDEQRILPDGQEQALPKPHPIRLTGGRSIYRGYSRMYLPYDLPYIELDAPEGVIIVSPDAVKIVELDSGHQAHHVDACFFQPRKRFEIKLPCTQSASYELQAVSLEGVLLGKRLLKIVGLDGEIVETKREFSLDSQGKPMASYEGLSGALLNSPAQTCIEGLEFMDEYKLELKELEHRENFDIDRAGLHRIFLDRLALSGSLDYGVARDFLRRLMQSQKVNKEPIFILLELRRLGHLELSTTQRGHTVSVHAVKPTLYSLPSMSFDKPIWAIAGTLRLDHWKLISNEKNAWNIHCLNRSDKELCSWILHIVDQREAKIACERIGFEFNNLAAVKIAEWSGNLNSFEAVTFHNTMESIGSVQDRAMRFNASKGVFSAPCNGNIWELWKARDLDTRVDDVYVLAHQSKGQYAFVRDSGWAKWLAIDKFASWASKYPGLEDIYPLPINYDSKSRTVWIPARVGLPIIMERALVMCSGLSPDVLTLQRYKQDQPTARILLSLSEDLPPILSSNPFYKDMAKGKWLAFHCVPEHIAQTVARKLGAILDIF